MLDEGAGLGRFERLLDHRVAAAANVECLARIDARPRIAFDARELGQARDGVELGERRGNLAEAPLLFLHLGRQLANTSCSMLKRALRRRRDAPFDLDSSSVEKRTAFAIVWR